MRGVQDVRLLMTDLTAAVAFVAREITRIRGGRA
jgi:hypothetical protein